MSIAITFPAVMPRLPAARPNAVRTMLDAEERELVHRLKLRDEAAFSAFVLRYQERVFRLLLRMLGDRAEAEDLAQEVFISIFKAIDGFRGDSQLSTWVYRVAANHCRNRIKYLTRRRRQLTEGYDEQGDDHLVSAAHHGRTDAPDQLIEAKQTESLLQAGLLSLDDEQRELIVLREVEHLSYEEIMAITGLPEGTVKSRLFRARAGLREYIERAERGRKR
ncbi:MAG: sigma-70 family RNA polymerase sigma factor [Polyangiales bacterium]